MYYSPPDPAARSDWAVACTAFEPTPLVVSYAAHHIAMGAAEVVLYLDRPQPDLEAILTRMPRVRFFVCDDEYWRTEHRMNRPAAVLRRQSENIFHAYHGTAAGWLAHVDADEFLHAEMPLGVQLAALPAQVDAVLFRPHERAFVDGRAQRAIFDGFFRAAFPPGMDIAHDVMGDLGRMTDGGVLGHTHGKSMLRTGRPLVPGLHAARRPKSHAGQPIKTWTAQRAWLLHFDGLTALHWCAKLRRATRDGTARFLNHRKSDRHRWRQMVHLAELDNRVEGAFDLHQSLRVVPQAEVDRLLALGLGFTHRPGIDRALAALGLAGTVDLSRAAFDAALVDLQPDIADWLQEWEVMLARADERRLVA